ncbi:cyanophycinase [Leucobacter sp. CSA2]|uniref:Cyanophycinase n=1 Tax=Leucobacter edaphi TaxID=2796472 RepID=A0A934QCN1_9MICO|nr:cyanophycinase [Leucobacter edaphi]MBK0422190.1 cyanophycinase [Leucobacter edaphi]
MTSLTSPRRRRPSALLLSAALLAGGIGLPTAAAHAEEGQAAPAVPTAQVTQSGPLPGGYTVLIGGGIEPKDPTSEAIIQEIVDLAKAHAEGKSPRIAIVTAGSEPAPNATEASDGEEYDNATANGIYYGDWFRTHGVEVYAVPIDQNPNPDYPGDPYTAKNAAHPEVVAQIEQSDAIYFGGGDQSRYVRALMTCSGPDPSSLNVTSCADTPALAAMRRVVDGGGVSAGSSAGLAIQQGPGMITGGEPYPSWRDGASPGSFDDDRLGYVPAGGFAFFSEGLIDSHFARRDRQPRIVRLAMDRKQDRAFGVEENTALVVDRAARTGRVVGALGVSAFDLRQTTFDGLNASGISYSYLTAGSTIDFAARTETLAGSPTTAPGTGSPPAPATDIWGSSECEGGIFGTLNLAQALLASNAARAHGDTCVAAAESPSLRVTLNRAAGTEWNTAGGFAGLRMSITGTPDVQATAEVDGISAQGTLPLGSTAKITVTVRNSGAVPLAGVSAEAHPSRAGTSTEKAAQGSLLLPGASRSFSFTRQVTQGAQRFEVSVSGLPASTDGNPLDMDAVSGKAEVAFTGARPSQPGTGGNGTGGNVGNGGNGGDGPPGASGPGSTPGGGSGAHPSGTLARTGGSAPMHEFAGAGAVALIAAGAAAISLAGAARARRRSRLGA